MPPVPPMKTHVRLVGGDVAACVLCERTVERDTIMYRRAWVGWCWVVLMSPQLIAPWSEWGVEKAAGCDPLWKALAWVLMAI